MIAAFADNPDAGTVRLDGVDPFAGDAVARAAFRNRRIGFVVEDLSVDHGIVRAVLKL